MRGAVPHESGLGGRASPSRPPPEGGGAGPIDASSNAAPFAASQSSAPSTGKSNAGDAAKGNVAKKEEEAAVESGGMSGTALWRPQYHGKIRSFNEQKGFGFVDCQETLRAFGRDVFIHRFQMAEAGLWVGQDVVFEVELNKMGQPQARRLQACSMAESMQWDFNGGMGQDFFPGVGWASRGHSYSEGVGMGKGGEVPSTPEPPIEEMLRKCSGSADMWEIIEQYGHSFGKKHVVTALYQLGLCRQYERRSSHTGLTSALVDRLVLFSPRELTADEASRVLWALAILEEVSNHSNAHRFAIELGEEAAQRFHEYSPAQMASFVNSLSRLVKAPEEDELVGKITTNFSDYALGNGTLPRFPPDEIRHWTDFLQSVSSPYGFAGTGGPGGCHFNAPPPRPGGVAAGGPGGHFGPMYHPGGPGGMLAGGAGMGPHMAGNFGGGFTKGGVPGWSHGQGAQMGHYSTQANRFPPAGGCGGCAPGTFGKGALGPPGTGGAPPASGGLLTAGTRQQQQQQQQLRPGGCKGGAMPRGFEAMPGPIGGPAPAAVGQQPPRATAPIGGSR